MALFKKKDKAAKGAEAEEAASDAADKPAAEGAEGAEGEGEPKKKGLPIKLIVIGLVALLVLGGGGGAGAYFFVFKKKGGEEHAQLDEHGKPIAKGKAKEKGKKKEKGGGHGGGEGKEGEKGGGTLAEGPDGIYFYTLPSFQVNMQAADGRPTFMKLDVTFEITDEHIAEQINEEMPRVQDTLQTFLRELRPEDLAGSAGTFRLRQELARRINLMIAPAKVEAVLIQNMLIT